PRCRPWGWTRRATGCRSRRPPTTPAGASSPNSTAPPRFPGCGTQARPPATAHTAPPGRRRTPSPAASASRPASRRRGAPEAPAPHYTCGGVVADLDGATSRPGLWVAGEAACNGVHGANRLASNSLLDGMVFGPRVVEAVGAGRVGPQPTGAMRCVLGGEDPG